MEGRRTTDPLLPQSQSRAAPGDLSRRQSWDGDGSEGQLAVSVGVNQERQSLQTLDPESLEQMYEHDAQDINKSFTMRIPVALNEDEAINLVRFSEKTADDGGDDS